MDCSFVSKDNGTCHIHGISEETLNEWRIRTGKEITILPECKALVFKIGNIEIKLFT